MPKVSPHIVTFFQRAALPRRASRTFARNSRGPVFAACSIARLRDGEGRALEAHVDCWIGVASEGSGRTVTLAGRLTLEQVPELLAVCGDIRPLRIDLTDLTSADAAGIDVLQRLRESGAELARAPGYIQLKLDTQAGPHSPLPPIRHRDRSG